MFSAWANDLKGVLWWCNSDQEVLEFPPYTLTAYERELGGGRKTVVAAINFEPREIVCPVKMDGALGRVWRGNVKADSIVLPPNEAAVFEVVAP